MHLWGDKDFDWAMLDEAMEYIYVYVRRRSGTYIGLKEKYGTIRYSFVSIPSIIRHLKLEGIWVKYSKWLLRRAIFNAVKKWPSLEDEILSDADEEIVGTEIHSKYWRQL